MQALALQAGDTFVELAPGYYHSLSDAEKSKQKFNTVVARPVFCDRACDKLHLKLAGGKQWCIPTQATVTVVENKANAAVAKAQAAA